VTTLQPSREERFRSLYADAYDDVLRFAQRRVDPAQAEDVAAEAFLVAWRRIEEAPAELGDRRAWLFGIARHCLLNARRGQGRHRALAVRLADADPAAGASRALDAETVALRLDLVAAWSALGAGEQEVLALSVFEHLDSRRAGRVLGVTAVAYRLRLMRARHALARELDRPRSRPALAATMEEPA
jgi:RNA polymerase sigma-70 factor (ECF subfamily)